MSPPGGANLDKIDGLRFSLPLHGSVSTILQSGAHNEVESSLPHHALLLQYRGLNSDRLQDIVGTTS